VNGTLGTVVDIIWPPDAQRHELPLAVLVECKKYTGPTLWRSGSRTDEHPDGIPIVPIPVVNSSFDLSGHSCSRTQLPLRLAWAVTVHKSQGLTLEVVKIGLGKREFCAGLTFVALSRATAITGIMFGEHFDYSRVQNLGGRALDERRLDFIRRYHNI
jgi:ATP-dependent exoDNAse (exonuclease V) alpha subunit